MTAGLRGKPAHFMDKGVRACQIQIIQHKGLGAFGTN